MMVVLLCNLRQLVDKIHIISNGLMVIEYRNRDWTDVVTNIIREIYDELERAKESCPEYTSIIEAVTEELRFYVNFGANAPPPFIGGYLSALANILASNIDFGEYKVVCVGKRFSEIEILKEYNISDRRFTVFLAETMVDNVSAVVVLAMSSSKPDIVGFVFRIDGKMFAISSSVEDAVNNKKIGDLEVDPIQINRLYEYVKGDIPFYKVCSK